ncbi:MAG: hypothetical protein IKZ39_09285, partial [Lachnospiraceae bacterium]|nr:hypothetical protein [Lachnospiraceae bacterium]
VLGDFSKALDICTRLQTFLNRSISKDRYYAYLDMLLSYTQSEYYFKMRNIPTAKEYSSKARRLSLEYFIYPLKLEIFILDRINDFMMDNSNLSADFSYVLEVASHLKCSFLTELIPLLKEIGMRDEYTSVEIPELPKFETLSFDADPETMSEDSFDISEEDALTIGPLIGELRRDQAIPMRKLCDGLCSVSKLSKIESRSQEPSVYLAEALLNRLGYSERDFVFYGNDKESEYSYAKNNLISLALRGATTSPSIDKDVELCLNSEEPLVRQLGMLFENIKDATSPAERKRLYEALDISLPGFNLKSLSNRRLSWAEISILNSIVINCIRSNDLKEANLLNDILYAYSKGSFIKPGYKNIALITPVKNRLRILYNMEEYKKLTEEFNSIDDEFLLKNFNLANDLFFYSSQSFGETKEYESMKKHARISAGYFTLFGNTKRCDYLLAEIKNDFGIVI